VFFKNSCREFHFAKRRFIRHKRLYVSLLELLFVIIVIVQLLKSNWRGALVKEVKKRTLYKGLGER